MAVPHSGIPSPSNPPPDAEVDDLVAGSVAATSVTADQATIDNLEATAAVIADLDATEADVDTLTAGTANIDTLVAGALTAPIDHGAVGGLTDDDHPQYARVTGGGKETVSTVAASGSTETINLANGNVHRVTLTANCTFSFAGATNGVACRFRLILKQDATGSRLATWPGGIVWIGGAAPTLSTAADAEDIIEFLSIDGGVTWYGMYVPAPTAGPFGTLGYAQITASQSGITTEVDVTGLSATVTVGTGRRIRISAHAAMNSTIGTDRIGLAIWEGANELQVSRIIPGGNGANVTAPISVVLTPSAGSHTYKITAERSSGTGTVTVVAAAAFPAYILVEDLGPA